MKKMILIGMLLSSLLLTSVSYADTSTKSDGSVIFEPYSGITDPHDPIHPENEVHPIDEVSHDQPEIGQNGPLSIDFASSFNFGINEISNQDQTYYAEAQTYTDGTNETPPFVQVTDNRGTTQGWTLSLKQQGQFEAMENTEYKILHGSQLSLRASHVNSATHDVTEPKPSGEVHVDPNGAEVIIMKADNGAGAGTWELYWGGLESIDRKSPNGKSISSTVSKGIQLNVPGETPKSPATYYTTLVWSLKNTPDNK